MKRLRIIAGVDPREGGPIEGIRQQASHHAAAGIDEHVVSLDAPDAPWVAEFPMQMTACGEPISIASGWKSRLPWRKYGYRPGFVRWLKDHAREYDIVTVHGLWNYSTMGARLALVGSGIPYIVFTHGMLDPWFKRNYPLKSALKQVFWWFNEGPLLNGADYVLFTSEEERALAQESFGPYRVRERVVSYGTSDPPAYSSSQSIAFRAKTTDLVRPYLLYLSRIHPKKGCDLLINAFADGLAAQSDIDLVIAGPASDKYLDQLKKFAQARGVASRIHWPGMLTGDAKWGAFRDAEAFVLPSHQENFGIVVAEAMACAKAVLITDKVNIWREVAQSGAGLVEPDDQEGVFRLLQRYFDHSPEERQEMAAMARRLFSERFEIGGVAQSLNKACRDAIVNHSQTSTKGPLRPFPSRSEQA
jgi:glycosyltransferase involved in cell wall biosynthesis